MPRLKNIDPKTDSGPGADMLNGPLKEKQINIFKGLAAHPSVLQAYMSWAQGSKGGALTDSEHEVVQLLAAQNNHCEYCVSAHTSIASRAGISENDCLDIRRRTSDDPKIQALINFAAEAIDDFGNVSDDTLEAFMNAGYDSQAAIEVIAGISVMTFTSFYNHVNNTVLDLPKVSPV
ncbi:MAG: carboxymuconolactone decarboxylase family protein [Planctomycetota bacterium]|nr:carboxymuconolactone decarboxylase family protein [Planctomycetota bacterium]